MLYLFSLMFFGFSGYMLTQIRKEDSDTGYILFIIAIMVFSAIVMLTAALAVGA